MTEPQTEPEPTLPTSDCTVCRHPDAAAIDAGLLGGTPIRTMAETYGLTRSSVGRHRLNHLSLQAITDEPVTERTEGLRLVDVHTQLASLADRLEAVVELATRTRKAPAAVAAMRELRQTLVAIAEVQATPELQQAASLELLQSWMTERAVDGVVRMIDFVLKQFGLDSNVDNRVPGPLDGRGQLVAGLVADCLRRLNDGGVEARFAGVDTSKAHAFLERRALDRAAAVEAEVLRRVEVELRRREAQARPAIEAHEQRAIEGGAVWLA
jgi:hypothetical protein